MSSFDFKMIRAPWRISKCASGQRRKLSGNPQAVVSSVAGNHTKRPLAVANYRNVAGRLRDLVANMTSEVALLNKSAIALAADSATTVTYWENNEPVTPYFKGANKIFNISRHHPVGVMTFAAL